MSWLIIFVVVGIIGFTIYTYRKAVSDDGRIDSLFRVYSHMRKKYPSSPERFYLEQVAMHHIHPQTGRRWGDMGYSGKEYIDGVFEDQEIDIKGLIAHFISLEFPKKYPVSIDLDVIEREVKGEKITPRSKLKMKVNKAYEKYAI